MLKIKGSGWWCYSSDPGFQILHDNELITSVGEKSVEKEDDLNVKIEADKRPTTIRQTVCFDRVVQQKITFIYY